KSWGSYEAWSDLVRSAVVCAGLPDPAATRHDVVSRSDSEVAALRAFIEAWPDIDPQCKGLSATALLRKLDTNREGFQGFRTALAEFCPAKTGQLPTSQELGYRLRKYSRRNVGGRCLDSRPSHGGVAAWFVHPVG